MRPAVLNTPQSRLPPACWFLFWKVFASQLKIIKKVKQSPEQTEEDVSDEELSATAGGIPGVTDRNRIDD